MARYYRIKSISGYYHIMQRGVGKQIIFEDEYDYINYYNLLTLYMSKYCVELVAYCIMDNHVHIVARTDDVKSISKMMLCIGTCYAQYYNEKYSHVGHVFQGRYKSQIIEDAQYLIRCVLYVHYNPENAGLCAQSQYKWSSYNDYARAREIPGYTNTKYLLEIIGGREAFKEQTMNYCHDSDDERMFEDNSYRKSIEEAELIIKNELGFENGKEIKTLTRAERNNAIEALLLSGVSIRKIERVTGVSRGAIQRIQRS